MSSPKFRTLPRKPVTTLPGPRPKPRNRDTESPTGYVSVYVQSGKKKVPRFRCTARQRTLDGEIRQCVWTGKKVNVRSIRNPRHTCFPCPEKRIRHISTWTLHHETHQKSTDKFCISTRILYPREDMKTRHVICKISNDTPKDEKIKSKTFAHGLNFAP
jgi:hypothetical protein